jgi:23S rRNA (guanosine2251-2'-O)-methyltransferase
MVYEESKIPLVLVLDHITDVRNFGAIARAAECAGVHAIIIPEQGAAQINSDAMKTSSGALNFIPVCRVKSLNDTLNFLSASGLTLVATTEKATDEYTKADYTTPTAIVFGAEDIGISNELLNLCGKWVKIPVFGKIESLNVSVVTAVMAYEVVRQRTFTKH